MDRTAVAVVVFAALVAGGLAFGVAYLYGVGPLEEDPADGLEEPDDAGDVVEVDDEDDDAAGGDDVGDARDGPAFEMEITEITHCGETCRDVDVTLRNNMDVEATEVVFYTRIYSGASTSEDDVVWADNRDVGAISAGDTLESTDRVELTSQKANDVRREDGDITIETTVESSQETVTFVRRENVI